MTARVVIHGRAETVLQRLAWGPNGKLVRWPAGDGMVPSDVPDTDKLIAFNVEFEPASLALFRRRARERGTSIAEQIREAIHRGLASER